MHTRWSCFTLTILQLFIQLMLLDSRLYLVHCQDAGIHFTTWGGFYYIFYNDVAYWQEAVENCTLDNGWLPVISDVENVGLYSFYVRTHNFQAGRPTPFPDSDYECWMGVDCSGTTCTNSSTVISRSFWSDAYPQSFAADNSDLALYWRIPNDNGVGDVGYARYTDKEETFRYMCKYDDACESERVECNRTTKRSWLGICTRFIQS